MTTRLGRIGGLGLAALLAALPACSRRDASSASSSDPPGTSPPPLLAPPPGQPAPQTPTPAQAPLAGPELAPAGPRADLRGDHYSLAVALAPVASVPGDSSLAIEVHGAAGYHVNEQYPIAVDLEFQNATAAKSSLRRADAAEVTQAVARFALPLRVTGAGALVRGRARFAVCSEENCVPETRSFAVNLP